MSLTPLPPSPRKVCLWRIFFALPFRNGPLPAELKFRENTAYEHLLSNSPPPTPPPPQALVFLCKCFFFLSLPFFWVFLLCLLFPPTIYMPTNWHAPERHLETRQLLDIRLSSRIVLKLRKRKKIAVFCFYPPYNILLQNVMLWSRKCQQINVPNFVIYSYAVELSFWS